MPEKFGEQFNEAPEQIDISAKQETQQGATKKDVLRRALEDDAKKEGVDLNLIASLFGDYAVEAMNKRFGEKYG